MLRIVKIICVLLVICEIVCTNDVCDQEDKQCSVEQSELFHSKRNFSSDVFDGRNETFLLNGLNFTSADDFPYDFVPQISTEERDYIDVLSQKYLRLQKPFDMTISLPGISFECRRDSLRFLDSLKNFELWALKMHDASAKLASGLLNGNIIQFGDFDQCIGVQSGNLQGKYCLAYLQPTVAKSLLFTNHLRKRLQSYDAFKSEFDDPGHRVPRYSTINWGLCIPSSCTHKDVELAVAHYIKSFINGTGIEVKVRVEEEMCHVRDDHWMEKLDRGTKIAISVFILLIVIIVTASLYDYYKQEEKNELLTAFSLIRNIKNFISVERDSGDIRTAHAIRFFNALMLVISHKCMAIFFNPYANRTAMSETMGNSWTVMGRAASLYTDPFLMISGMLTAYSLFGRLQRGGKINILKEYASRYLRIMPPLAFLIGFCTYILPLIGDGPQWNLVVGHHTGICKQYWWRNLLFIHNWFGFSNMCLTHTHHIGIDSELFVIAPFLILMLWKWPKKGTYVLISLGFLSTIARYYVTYTKNLSNYVFFGTSLKMLFATADHMYILPPHRFTVYAMGIFLGFALRNFKDMKLSQSQIRFGWCVSIASVLIAFFGPAPMGDIDYKFNVTHAAHYAAFSPILWCIFFGWIIFTSQLGYTNAFTRALEWRGFLISTKMSYALYLTQFPLFFYNVGNIRTPLHFGIVKTVIDLNEMLCIVIASIILTVFIELPFNNLKKVLLDKKRLEQATKSQLDVNSNIKLKDL